MNDLRVKYIGKRDTLAFERGKVYEVMSVEKGWFRIMTELDEDYLFPPHIFEMVEDDTRVFLPKEDSTSKLID